MLKNQPSITLSARFFIILFTFCALPFVIQLTSVHPKVVWETSLSLIQFMYIFPSLFQTLSNSFETLKEDFFFISNDSKFSAQPTHDLTKRCNSKIGDEQSLRDYYVATQHRFDMCQLRLKMIDRQPYLFIDHHTEKYIFFLLRAIQYASLSLTAIYARQPWVELK